MSCDGMIVRNLYKFNLFPKEADDVRVLTELVSIARDELIDQHKARGGEYARNAVRKLGLHQSFPNCDTLGIGFRITPSIITFVSASEY
jgi:hypothetical protein